MRTPAVCGVDAVRNFRLTVGDGVHSLLQSWPKFTRKITVVRQVVQLVHQYMLAKLDKFVFSAAFEKTKRPITFANVLCAVLLLAPRGVRTVRLAWPNIGVSYAMLSSLDTRDSHGWIDRAIRRLLRPGREGVSRGRLLSLSCFGKKSSDSP